MICVVGAGFSGLTLAYYLEKAGIAVEVYEEKRQCGGLLHTHHHALGLVETAANGLLYSETLADLCRDLGVDLVFPQPSAKKRYIFWQGRPKRWPLGFFESVGFVFKLIRNLVFKNPKRAPRNGESVAAYIERVFSKKVLQSLVAPALQGIYAGDPARLSARLILGRFFGNEVSDPFGLRYPRGRRKKAGTVAPREGMGALVRALENHLASRGVKIHRGETVEDYREGVQVWATPAWQAAKLYPELGEVESLGLVTVTLFYQNRPPLAGFGCLFPRSEKVRSLGVLWNPCIFEGRSSVHSETWILGGASDPEILDKSDNEVLRVIEEDRSRLFGLRESSLQSEITRWPKALPHYTLEWEKALETLRPKKRIYLHGNYLGRIGLSQILERSKLLAEKIALEAGSESRK